MADPLEFTAKIYRTGDKKRLKTGDKTYEYGTLSIRDVRLTPYVGRSVTVTVSPAPKKGKGKSE